MKKIMTSSILVTEAVAFLMFLILLFISAVDFLLVLVPVVEVLCGIFIFLSILRKQQHKTSQLKAALPAILGVLIAASIIILINIRAF